MRGRKVLLSLSSPRLFVGADTVDKRFIRYGKADSDAEISVRYGRLSYSEYAAAQPSHMYSSFKDHEGAFNCHMQNNIKKTSKQSTLESLLVLFQRTTLLQCVPFYFFRRLSLWMASFVPMVCSTCTSSTSRITATSITRYL